MRSRTLCLALLLLSVPAAAQMGPGGRPGQPPPPTQMIPPLGQDFVFEVGAWAEYTMARGPMQMTMRFAVVGKEACGAATCHWLETKAKLPGGELIHKMLLSGDPSDPKSMKKLFFKPPGGAAMEIPVAGAPAGPGAGGPGGGPPPAVTRPGAQAAPKPDFKEIGSTKMAISGKDVDAKHMRASFQGMTMDAWVSDKIKLFGLVKLQAPMMTMELKDFGTGATPSF